MSTHQDNAQESNAQESNNPRPQDPTSAAQQSAEGQKLSRNGLTDFAPADPHEVRTRLTRRGSQDGLELDGGTGVVFIPQHALPDLRRRLLLAQERFTAMSGPVPGKRRKRRPASAR